MRKTRNFLYLFGVFLVFILLLIVFLYNFTTKALSDSYTNSAKNQLTYANNNLAEKSKEIELVATSILTYEAIRFFEDKIGLETFDEYEYVQTLRKIKDRITQVEFNSIGIEAVYIYWPEIDLVIATKTVDTVKKNSWIKDIKTIGRSWNNIGDTVYFSTSYPYINNNGVTPNYYVIIEMKNSYLKEIKQVATNIHGAQARIRLPDGSFLSDLESPDAEIDEDLDINTGESEIKFSDSKIKVLSKYNPENGIQIISYFNMETFLSPVYQISAITFVSTFAILVIGLLLMYLFYRNILSHLDLLIKKFRRVENGDLTIKIKRQSSNEFNYVFEQFNQMVSGVNRLLISLNNEYKRHELAERKQLQSQINPHFLYNSLFYIISVAGNPEAVRRMSTHLAEYYQYTTKTTDLVLLEDEINFAHSYLSIIALRKSINYEIKVEEDILDQMILPLLIQPLLENAVEHGIEEKEGAKHVSLMIGKFDGFVKICVEDDGDGLTEEEMRMLEIHINCNHKENHSKSVGLWNVNQRLINYYGSDSSINFERSSKFGGLKVSFYIKEDEI